MTAELPPPLADLAAQYDQLYDAAQAGHISHADALTALAALTCSDAAGRVWAINPEGEFTAADYPGAPSVPVDPATFAAAAPAAAPQAAQPMFAPPGPWDTAATPAMPAPAAAPAPVDDAAGWPGVDTAHHGPSATPSGWGASWDDPGADAVDDSGDAMFAGLLTPPQVPGGGQSGPTAAGGFAPARSLRDAEAGSPGLVGRLTGLLPSGVAGKLPSAGFLGRNRGLVAVVLVGLVILIAAIAHSGGTPATKLPSASGSTSGSSSASAMPTTGSAPVTALPTADDFARVRSALVSGKRDVASSVLAGSTDEATAAGMTAYFYGADKTGIDLAAGPAAADGATGAVQTWTLSDHATHKPLGQLTVHWSRTSTGWKLAAAPAH